MARIQAATAYTFKFCQTPLTTNSILYSKEKEIAGLQQKVEEDATEVAALQKKIRELEAKISELEEDLENERMARQRV